MHCPQCGQEQISGENRFCKNCGFSLEGVRELLAAGNASPTPDKESRKPAPSARREGVRQGVILLFVFMVAAPSGQFIGGQKGTLLPAIIFMAGLMRILYALIFQEGAPKKKPDNSLPDVDPITTEQLGEARRAAALPPPQSVPVFSGRRMDTAEMVSPPSVTEHPPKSPPNPKNPKKAGGVN